MVIEPKSEEVRYMTQEQNHDLTEIRDVISEAMDNPLKDIISSGVVGVLGIVNPIAGVAAASVNTFVAKYDEFKLCLLIKGLASGKNIEKSINKLYHYVKSSPTRAISVANLFKKAINAENPKACVIYGMILAKHTNDKSDFTQDELIACKALESATDYDLGNFKEIMEKYLEAESSSVFIQFPPKLPSEAEYQTTCDWCVYNRIFTYKAFDASDGVLDMTSRYTVAKPAYVLLQYVTDASQVWDENVTT